YLGQCESASNSDTMRATDGATDPRLQSRDYSRSSCAFINEGPTAVTRSRGLSCGPHCERSLHPGRASKQRAGPNGDRESRKSVTENSAYSSRSQHPDASSSTVRASAVATLRREARWHLD